MRFVRVAVFVALSGLAGSLAAQEPVPVPTPFPAVDLTGNWCGEWIDFNSGHRGPLRAEFRKCGDQRYEVSFAGRFWKIFPFRYRVTLDVVGQEGDTLLLSGVQDLGLFGCFRYTARATPCSFVADFTSRKYNGQFRLSR